MRVVLFLLAAFAAYVVFRAGAVFAGAAGAIVAVLLLAVVALGAWRRSLRPAAAGAAVGVLLSVAALAL